MRLLALPFLLIYFLACGTDVAPTVEVNMNGRLQEDPAASEKATVNEALNLRMGEAVAAQGETVCLPIVAQNFRNLIGFQYTIRWDSTLLDFDKVQNFGLPAYGPSQFGDRFADQGYLSTLWTDAAVKGHSVPDGTTLFELCLTNKAPAGTSVPVRFTNGPTTFEVIAGDMSQWKFRYSNGKVVSR